jgi:hypothetical protein
MIDDKRLESLTARMRELFKDEKNLIVAAVAFDVDDGTLAVMCPTNVNPMALFELALKPGKEVSGKVVVDSGKTN